MSRIVYLIALLIASIAAHAAPPISLAPYYNASCPDYVGTWQGYISDPSDLFNNGGPWPITMHITLKNGQILGQTSAIRYTKGSNTLPARPFYASCQNGILSDLFWGNPTQCGSVTQQGGLISKNVMIVQLAYENSMTGTTFIAYLTRASNQYNGPRIKTFAPFDPKTITSCH